MNNIDRLSDFARGGGGGAENWGGGFSDGVYSTAEQPVSGVLGHSC
jgi:hypothetical protein